MSSYYVPLPAAESPRNALLDFSPIRQAFMDRRNAEQQDYERQRQAVLDQRALDNQAYERGRNALSDKMAQQKFAWESEDRNQPKLMTLNNKLIAIDRNDPYHPRTVYQNQSLFDKMVGGGGYISGGIPQNSLAPQSSMRTNASQFDTQQDFYSLPINARPSFNQKLENNSARPMRGVSVDMSNENSMPSQATQQSNFNQQTSQSITEKPTINIRGRNFTEDDAWDLFSSDDENDKARGKQMIEYFNGLKKQDQYGSKAELSAVYGREYDNIQSFVKPYNIMKDAYTNIETTKNTYSNPELKDEYKVSDLVLISNFAKLIDPTSKVSPDEKESILTAPSLPAQYRLMWNNLFKGGTLDQATRAQIINQAQRIYENQSNVYKNGLDMHRRRAIAQGLNPDLLIQDIFTPVAENKSVQSQDATANDFEIIAAAPAGPPSYDPNYIPNIFGP